ncbi:MAG: hypothetical protein AAGP08_18160, partial [Pseudomonadota bacterium]
PALTGAVDSEVTAIAPARTLAKSVRVIGSPFLDRRIRTKQVERTHVDSADHLALWFRAKQYRWGAIG